MPPVVHAEATHFHNDELMSKCHRIVPSIKPPPPREVAGNLYQERLRAETRHIRELREHEKSSFVPESKKERMHRLRGV